jgi:hypothetical protein
METSHVPITSIYLSIYLSMCAYFIILVTPASSQPTTLRRRCLSWKNLNRLGSRSSRPFVHPRTGRGKKKGFLLDVDDEKIARNRSNNAEEDKTLQDEGQDKHHSARSAQQPASVPQDHQDD